MFLPSGWPWPCATDATPPPPPPPPPPPLPQIHTHTHARFHLCSPNHWHAPKAGTDYSPVCLFWLWLLLHPDSLKWPPVCAVPHGIWPGVLHMGTITRVGGGLHAAHRPSRLGRRGLHPLHNPLNSHFHPQSLQLITVIALPMVSLWSGVVILPYQSSVQNVSVRWQASVSEL